MFSGIIETTIRANKIQKFGNSISIEFSLPKSFEIKVADSISIDGICSTVEKKTNDHISVHYMPETLAKTTISKILQNHSFNLERSLTLQSLIGGHLVTGHIDTTATLKTISQENKSKLMKFSIDNKFTKYIINKGSIAVNGVSLTIVSVNKTSFTVALIPYTQTHTNLGLLKIGDFVNIEVDLIAKYLEKLR